MRRSKLAILLILAFVAALAAPVHAAWICPDGTPCAALPARSTAAGSEEPDGCCKKQADERCGPHRAPATGSDRAWETVGHCRYAVMPKPDLKAMSPTVRLIDFAWLAALPAPTLHVESVLTAIPAWGWPETADYRPPPIATERPSRAPPTLQQS